MQPRFTHSSPKRNTHVSEFVWRLGDDIGVDQRMGNSPNKDIRINKLTSVFLCVCPLIDDKLGHHVVKVAVAVYRSKRIKNALKKLMSICFLQ